MGNKEFNIILCKRIAILRKSNNLTIEKLAYQSGISKGGLSEMTILKICAGLGITMKDFFDYKEINDFQNQL